MLVVFDPTTSAPGSSRRKSAAAPWRALYLDSLGGSKPRASALLGSFLKCVSEDTKQQPNAGADALMTALRVQVPQQPNHYDCGFYLVMCAPPTPHTPHPTPPAPPLASTCEHPPSCELLPSFASHCGALSCLTGARCALWCPGLSTSWQRISARSTSFGASRSGWLTPSSRWPLPSGSTADPRMHARTHPPNQQLAAHCYLPGFPLLQFTSAEIDALRADTLATVKGTIAAQQLQPPPSRRRCIG